MKLAIGDLQNNNINSLAPKPTVPTKPLPPVPATRYYKSVSKLPFSSN
jgi:hypothetical protein